MTYTDTSGAVQLRRVKMKDLSASWVLENPNDVKHVQPNSLQVFLRLA